jgi:leader peptidase (prepilin peptidase) / N-methyltransferase
MPPPLELGDLPPWFFQVFAATWGAVWGSFANVVIYRWPRELSLTHPGSRCPHCEHPVRAYDNVPVLGWLWLRGKCRDCKAPISPRYPLVEAMYGATAFTLAERIAHQDAHTLMSTALALFMLRFAFAWGLLTAAFIDMETFLIPDFISLGGAVLGLVAAFMIPGLEWKTSLQGAVLGFALLYAPLFIWSKFLKREGVGMGDPKLLAMIGTLLGPTGVLFSLVGGATQGILAVLISRVTGWQLGPDPSLLDDEDEENAQQLVESSTEEKQPEVVVAEPPSLMRTPIPFGPFLAMGALEYLLGADVWVQRAIAILMEP